MFDKVVSKQLVNHHNYFRDILRLKMKINNVVNNQTY